jgi:hypothetical protein
MPMQGGKMDDITVLVAVVTEEDMRAEPDMEKSSWETGAILTTDTAAHATEDNNGSATPEIAAATAS